MEHDLAWHFPVIWYLYLAGLGAGAGPIPVILGVSLLILELGQPSRPLNLYKVINLSPMSIGSWFLLFFIITSLVYGSTFLPSFKPEKYDSLIKRLLPVPQ